MCSFISLHCQYVIVWQKIRITRQISMKELILALDADFEGYDAIKKLCDDAPK
ncbi:hypothetical protein [Dorea longicatena]|uniref:hypothetical protein n=1 Tax=Dorea longicatena TaxID=88431 RepID=UPI0022DFC079|nr:hypothetical protein [Dorea longicatena]